MSLPDVSRKIRQAGCTPVVSRRQMLQIGGLGLMGLSLPRLLAAESAAQNSGITPRADACVLIFLNGGPSHLDMWDMKPEAPEGIRGEFKPIATTVPGMQFSEHMPKLAKLAHRATIVRSMHHSVNNAHAAAVYTSLTGHDRGDNIRSVGGGPDEYPAMGSVLGTLRPPEREIVPHVCLPYITKEGAGGPPQSGFFGGMLGRAYDPLFVLKDPNSPEFAVPELTLMADVSLERLAAREALFRTIDERFDRGPGHSAYDSMDGFRRRALSLLTSAQTQTAFHISEEPDAVREAYGRNIYGQSVLLGRRMIEAGTRMVTHLLGAGRQRHVGYARQQFPQAQGDAAAAVRRRVQQPGQRPGRARHAGPHAGGRAGRLRPLAEGERQRRRARPLELLL